MASFLTAAAAAIGSSSIGSALVRILVAYGVSRLINKSTGQGNAAGAVDQGVRLQAAPDTTNPIPLLYGSAYLGGKITDAQITDGNQTMWYCLTLAEVPTSTTTRLSDGATITTTVDEIYWNNQRVYFKADGVTIDYLVNQDGIVDTSPRDLVKIYLYRNGSFNSMLPSDLGEYISPLPAVPADARGLFPAWDNTFRMAGLTFALVKVSYNRDKGITGLPELQFKVSNNLFKPGDAIYSFLRNFISGAGLPDAEIDTASLVALNDYADDEVNYIDETDGLTYQLGDRYQINGVVNPGRNVLDNLTSLANNCGAFVNYDIARGLWGVKINRDATTALTFDDSNIISGIDLTGTALDNMYNSVIVEFPHRQLRDQIDTIRIDLPDEFRNANEPDNVLNIRLDLLNEPLQARSLAYLELYQNRMDRVVTFTTDYSKINSEAGDVITITNSIYGFVNQPFKIVRVREIESEAGGIAVEITAQEYDATMYTAGGQPRRPRVPSVPIDIPDIGVIGTPAAPTVVQLNNVAVPALDVTGLTPLGIVDRFEFWYSTDAGATYKVLGSRSNSNGSPYNQNTSLTFRAASLPAGSYLFKVRGGNENAFGDFSPATATVVWAPVQVTDQVTDATTIGGSMSDLIGPLAMGAVAYFAYQALYPEIMKALGDSALGEIFGIPTSAVQEMKNAAGNFKLIQVGDSIQTPYNNDTITFVAGDGIEITAEADAGTITISSTGGTGAVSKIIAGSGITVTPTGGTGDVTISLSSSTGGGGSGGGPVDGGAVSSGSAELVGSVFPVQYLNANTITQSIFTHNYLAFSNTSWGGVIRTGNIVTVDTILKPSIVNSRYDQDEFYYYSTCNFNPSLPLEAQAWGDWILWTGPSTRTETYIESQSNPPIDPAESTVYIVDGEFEPGGIVGKDPSAYQLNYDYFIPNIDVVKTRTITTNTAEVKAEPGKVVIFGASLTNFGNVVAFNQKTIFGIATSDKVVKEVQVAGYPGQEIVYGNAKYVTASPTVNDLLYYSSDNVIWNKVTNVTFAGTSATDIVNKGIFKLAPFNPVTGKFLAWRNFGAANSNGFIGSTHNFVTSTNGIDWSESGTISSSVVLKINMNPAGHYIANTFTAIKNNLGFVVYIQTASKYSIDGGTTWINMAFLVSDAVSWDAANSRWVDQTSYFAAVTSTTKTTFAVQSGVKLFPAHMDDYILTIPKPSEVPANYTQRRFRPKSAAFTGSESSSFVYGNNKIYGLHKNLFLRFQIVGYDSGAIDPNGGPGFYDIPLDQFISMYTITGNTITAASYNNSNLVADSVQSILKLDQYDSARNALYAFTSNFATTPAPTFITQIYADGTTVKHNRNSPSNGVKWLSIANGQYFASGSQSATNILAKITFAASPITVPSGTTATVAAVAVYSALTIAYATNYYYPGVVGTTSISRNGNNYGINANGTTNATYKITYST